MVEISYLVSKSIKGIHLLLNLKKACKNSTTGLYTPSLKGKGCTAPGEEGGVFPVHPDLTSVLWIYPKPPIKNDQNTQPIKRALAKSP